MHKLLYLIFIPGLILQGCANQTAPTGGPKDEAAPILLDSQPAQGQLHFKGQEIVLIFDEFVRTENPKEQFIITPTIPDDYEVKYKKNRVIIELTEALQDSTTYSINFREGIQDITEGNPADTLTLAFSTGSFLDSLSVTGMVKRLTTNEVIEDATVSLYNALDTLNIENSPPIYMTKTNEKGEFKFNNLKVGQYRIYAITDKNKNLTLESKSEGYGFLAETLKLDSNITDIFIPVQNMDIRPIELQSARQSGTTFDLKFNKSLDNYALMPFDTTRTLYSNFSDDTQKSIQIFDPGTIADSLGASITAMDSIGNTLTDTIYVKFEETKRKPSEFTTDVSLEPVVINAPTFIATIAFNKPIATVNYDSIYLYLDSTHIVHFNQETLQWNNKRDQLILKHDIDPDLFETEEDPGRPGRRSATEPKPATKADTVEVEPPPPPHLYLAKGSFISAEQDSSQMKNQQLIFLRPDELARILVEINTDAPSYFVQLVDPQNNVVDEIHNGKVFKFINVPPSEYRIRVLVDKNNNGQWDRGNIKKKEEPEPVYFYKSSDGNEILTPRANWDLGPNVITF